LKRGFRFHHFEGELHWLRLTREDWLASLGAREAVQGCP
jgi:hypothetical protein